MQVFKQFHKILLNIFNHMLPTIYTVKSLEPVLNCTEMDILLNVVKAGYGAFLSFFKEKSYSFFLLVDKDDHLSS